MITQFICLAYCRAKEKEVERAEKWANMSNALIIHGENAHRFMYSSKFRSRVYKGIPDCWRRDAWYFLVTNCLRDAKNDFKLKATYQVMISASIVSFFMLTYN